MCASARRGGEGSKSVLVNGVDPERHDDVLNLDLRLGKEFRMGPVGVTISADVFNVTDERTELQRQHRQFCGSAAVGCGRNLTTGAAVGTTNRITELQSPRVIRFGARLNF